jgi:hypothetical protein
VLLKLKLTLKSGVKVRKSAFFKTWGIHLSLLGLFLSGLYAAEKGLSFKKQLLYMDCNEACEIADFNKDGVLDISAGRNWYPGPDYVPHPMRSIPEFGKDYQDNNAEIAMDVDKDGWVDLVATTFKQNKVFWYKNPGQPNLSFGKLWQENQLGEIQINNEIVIFEDLDGDGVKDLITNSWIPTIPLMVSKLNPGETSISPVKVGSKNGHGLGYGDINGDGRSDILFQNGWYEQPVSGPYTENWKYHDDWNHKHASCPMIVTDLNGDGKNDIIRGIGHNYGLYWMEQLESKDGKTQWKEHLVDKSYSQLHTLAWFDLDGDGAKELVTGKRVRAHSGRDPGGNEQGVMYYYKWNKSELSFKRFPIAVDIGTGLHIKHADLNKDGKIDIVVSGKSGTYILWNQG